MYQELFDILVEWDGKQTNYLKELYLEDAENEAFFEHLVKLTIQEEQVQIATTWLIKHHYDNKNNLPLDLIKQLLDNCDVLAHWAAQLHILQIFPKLSLATGNLFTIENFIRNGLKSEIKFVRAAAYEAFFEMTKQLPDLQEELKALCEQAMKTESAAIQSKVRKVLKKLG